MNETQKYYDTNAEQFFDSTVEIDMNEIYQKFLPCLNAGARILDAGCGSGRDTKNFLSQGFKVDAFDASKELVLKAKSQLGVEVDHATFDSFKSQNMYDGIWACASLLHVPDSEIETVVKKLSSLLNSGGYFYISFKYGEKEEMRNGRLFSDYTLEKLKKLIERVGEVEIYEHWITSDLRPGREEEKWLNAVLKK